MKMVHLTAYTQDQTHWHKFYIAYIGQGDTLLGYPFFVGHNPQID